MLSFSSKLVHVYLSVREILSLLTCSLNYKCHIMQHFIRVFTVWQSTQYHYFFPTNVFIMHYIT